MTIQLALPITEIEAFCRRHGICKLALFGSVLRSDFRTDSDVDVLVEFEPGVRIGWEFFDLQAELSALLGRAVDLHTPNSLSPHFRDQVLRQVQVVYERTRSYTPAGHAQ
jgi:uncharacterized protein